MYEICKREAQVKRTREEDVLASFCIQKQQDYGINFMNAYKKSIYRERKRKTTV